MKLDAWQLITSIIEAGGVFKDGAYQVRNSSGQLHREDGPAVVYLDGSHSWYRNGHFHREGGPAIVYTDGSQYWYLNGQQVQPDGGHKT